MINQNFNQPRGTNIFIMKGWKTLLFAIVLAIAGTLEAFDWATIVPEGFEGLALGVIGIIVGWLRKLTTTPLGSSE